MNKYKINVGNQYKYFKHKEKIKYVDNVLDLNSRKRTGRVVKVEEDYITIKFDKGHRNNINYKSMGLIIGDSITI